MKTTYISGLGHEYYGDSINWNRKLGEDTYLRIRHIEPESAYRTFI
jgi:hypothetical protein